MSRETLKDFLNSKGIVADSISFVRKESPDGLGKDPKTDEELLDLVNETKGLLGDYLKFLIDTSNNEFKIKGGNELASSSKKGDDLVLADDQGAENIFVDQGTVLKSKLNEYSNSGKFDGSGTDLLSLIDKVGKNFSNHEKLKEIQGRPLDKYGATLSNPNGEENDIVQATQKMFLQNNRFANVGNENTKSFTEKPQNIQDFEKTDKSNNIGTLNIQNKFGEYDKNEKVVSIQELKQLGASLLLKSSGFSLGDTPGATGDTKEIIENIGEETAKNYDEFSGFTKINFSRLRAKNAKGFPENVSGDSYRAGKGEVIEKGTENLDEDPKNNKSFGSTYNSAFRFQGSTLKLHKIQAAISMIALKNIGQSFWQKFIDQLRAEDRVELSASTEKYVKENTKADVLTYMLGRSRKLNSLKLDQAIFGNLLTNTTYAYGDAVDRGLEIIFGKNERNDIEKVSNQKMLSQSPGFWLAISRSILKSLDNIFSKELNQGLNTEELFTVYKEIVDSNKFIQFFNVLAVIGDISLQTTGGVKTEIGDKNFKHHRDVDAIPDNRAIPGKSRQRFGLNKNELSWKQDAPSSMYILPANIIRAASRLNNTVIGESPVRGMLGSNLAKSTYFGVDVDGSFNRIPNEVVKVLEDKLDAEYVPFYIQDLRTNEIISFNAFLSTLTDSINPQYSSVNGYGRMDPVQIYQGTTRTLSVSFTLFATNREDYDNMWYKINKLVTLLYPQYTPGTLVSNGGGSKFYQPFSQVIGASPIVRLRIGDVIKSNYSRFGLARTFGIGDSDVNPMIEGFRKKNIKFTENVNLVSTGYDMITDFMLKIWLASFGSPHSIVNAAFKMANTPNSAYGKIAKNLSKGSAISLLSNILVNGFANPLAVGGIIKQLRDPNLEADTSGIFDGKKGVAQFKRQINNSSLINITTGNSIAGGYQTAADLDAFGLALRQMILKPNVINGYLCSETGKKYFLPRRIKVRVVEKGIMSQLSDQAGLPNDIIGYKVKVIDPAAPSELQNFGNEQHLIVRHSDILPDPKELFTNSILGAALFATDPIAGVLDSLVDATTEYALGVGIPNEITDFVRTLYARSEAKFMRPELNPFVRAIETTKGRGLAGTIGQISFDWLDDTFAWETDYNARAPMGCKISFGFDVIHDLPPGLDHSGYNRAPLYNVGEVMRNVSGDVYSDNGAQAEFNFRTEGGYASRVQGDDNKNVKSKSIDKQIK